MPTFNPPPNWPSPPPGWTPPPGWQPDPAWGPAPAGWQFWSYESWGGNESAPRMKCAAGLCTWDRLEGSNFCLKHLAGPSPQAENAGLSGMLQSRATVKATMNAKIVCPHCQVAGMVRRKTVKKAKGVSGGKATGALLTGGVSMLFTGLSRMEKGTELQCGNCGISWIV